MNRRIVFEDDEHHKHVRTEIVAPESAGQGVCWFDFSYEGPEKPSETPYGQATIYYLSIQPCGPWWFQQVDFGSFGLRGDSAKVDLRNYFNRFAQCTHNWSALKPTQERKCSRCDASMTAYWPAVGCQGMPLDVKVLGMVLAGEPHRNL